MLQIDAERENGSAFLPVQPTEVILPRRGALPALPSPFHSGAHGDSPVLALGPFAPRAPGYVIERRQSPRFFPGSFRAVASMSLPRCTLLWARLPAGRGAGPRAAPCSALRALVGPFPGVSGRVPCLAASSSASGGSKAPNTSLFVPLTVKPQGPSADGDVGAELTRPLDKSECWSLPAKLQGLRPGPAECSVCSFLEPSAPGPNS